MVNRLWHAITRTCLSKNNSNKTLQRKKTTSGNKVKPQWQYVFYSKYGSYIGAEQTRFPRSTGLRIHEPRNLTPGNSRQRCGGVDSKSTSDWYHWLGYNQNLWLSRMGILGSEIVSPKLPGSILTSYLQIYTIIACNNSLMVWQKLITPWVPYVLRAP